jgi:hypothetical protein
MGKHLFRLNRYRGSHVTSKILGSFLFYKNKMEKGSVVFGRLPLRLRVQPRFMCLNTEIKRFSRFLCSTCEKTEWVIKCQFKS